MVLRVERHRIDSSVYEGQEEEIPSERAERIEEVQDFPAFIGLSASALYSDARILLLLDPEARKSETWEAWVSAMQIYGSIFEVSAVDEGSVVDCMVDHEVRSFPTTGPDHYTNPGNWEVAFFLAVTCRDERRWRRLSEIPVDLLKEASGDSYNDYAYHWVSALQAFALQRDGLVDHLAMSFELSDPRGGAFGGDILDGVVRPEMNAFRYFVLNDSPKFNEALAQGLEAFRRHYTATPERAEDIDGVVPLGLLALACWAHDRSVHDPGFRLEVESDYLPKHILDGSWVGEFPT